MKLCESAHLRVSSEGSKSVEKASKRNKMEKANIRSEANIQFLLMQDNFFLSCVQCRRKKSNQNCKEY